ncbi:MAG: hypothetical protein WCH39_19755, partial [Schlesneria sp.]
SADRFNLLIGQIQRDAESRNRTYTDSKQLVMNRLSIETLQEVLNLAKMKVVLDAEHPVDLTFPPSRGEK